MLAKRQEPTDNSEHRLPESNIVHHAFRMAKKSTMLEKWVQTLDAAIAEGASIRVRCAQCQRFRDVNLVALRARTVSAPQHVIPSYYQNPSWCQRKRQFRWSSPRGAALWVVGIAEGVWP